GNIGQTNETAPLRFRTAVRRRQVWRGNCAGSGLGFRRKQLARPVKVNVAMQYKLARPTEFVHTSFTNCRRPPHPSPGPGQPAVTASMSRGDRGDNVGGPFALAV